MPWPLPRPGLLGWPDRVPGGARLPGRDGLGRGRLPGRVWRGPGLLRADQYPQPGWVGRGRARRAGRAAWSLSPDGAIRSCWAAATPRCPVTWWRRRCRRPDVLLRTMPPPWVRGAIGSPAITRTVCAALSRATRQALAAEPAWVTANGTITSRDVARAPPGHPPRGGRRL